MKRVLSAVLASLVVTGLGTLAVGQPARADAAQALTPAIVQLPCAAESGMRPSSGYPYTAPVLVTWVNETSQTVDAYWIDYSGQRSFAFSVAPGQSFSGWTWPTHSFVITDTSGNCMTIYRVLTGGGTVTIQ